MKRHEFSDPQWGLVAPCFPPRPRKRGGQWRDDRTILHGVFWRLHIGAAWRDLPARTGPWQGVRYRDRVFSPVTTLWGFLSQLLSEDHSCRDAVSRVIAHRASNGAAVCSPNTASYRNARSRLCTGVLSTLAKRTAQQLQASAAEEWKWNGRSVYSADGSHVSMPDTPENQARYPQPPQQQAGLGFPLA